MTTAKSIKVEGIGSPLASDPMFARLRGAESAGNVLLRMLRAGCADGKFFLAGELAEVRPIVARDLIHAGAAVPAGAIR